MHEAVICINKVRQKFRWKQSVRKIFYFFGVMYYGDSIQYFTLHIIHIILYYSVFFL